MENAMSTTTIELFRRHTEQQQPSTQTREHKGRKPPEPSQQTDKPNLVVEMSRIEHEVRETFDRASPADRDNIIRYLEMVIRNLNRQVGNE